MKRSLAFLACLALASTANALSFRGPASDPWYVISIQIEAKSLPRGVGFRVTSFDDERITHFTNAGATPFYLVVVASPQDWIRDLPADFVPNAMAVAGKAFRVAGLSDWEPDALPGISIAGFLKVTPGRDERALAMDGFLGARPIQVRGRFTPGRPARVELDGALPDGLRVLETPQQHTVIVNDGPVPLYTGTKFRKPVAWKTEVPFDYLATHKLVGARAYFAERIYPQTADGWRPVEAHDARITEREIDRYVRGIVLKQMFEDNRPADTRPPAPQPFELHAIHGAEKVLLRGRVVYDLNANYHPAASRYAFACHSCMGRPCPACEELRRARGRKAPERPATY